MSEKKFRFMSVQIEPALLAQLDARCDVEDMNRSQMIRRFIRKDLAENPLPGKRLELQEVPA